MAVQGNPRRVGTGQTADGRPAFVADGPSPRHVKIESWPGYSITAIWATDYDATAVPGSDDPTLAMRSFAPGPGGSRIICGVIPPGESGSESSPEFAEKVPGLGEAMSLDHPGMHETDTVDYDIIMSGQITMELDNGPEVTLGPGDILVQTGTRHAWHNRGTEPCVLYNILVGCPRR
jgi:mannose-6-phosphate isomerase-like protein (cupin superfamily)